ncbi:TPA: hypothetical protein CPT90_08845 [Candidatus Gastranaerophilales bacterium HUM_3]|nr:MAG TPA: hypothetical protein CPT90_08845 [Candidatus Gastranaerophilales bacterium HUM_3]DAB22699.1 MAG TPA: hypothetical protein CPT94_04795 [Candidatus Gastranaerophilales bacterium HUM_22]
MKILNISAQHNMPKLKNLVMPVITATGLTIATSCENSHCRQVESDTFNKETVQSTAPVEKRKVIIHEANPNFQEAIDNSLKYFYDSKIVSAKIHPHHVIAEGNSDERKNFELKSSLLLLEYKRSAFNPLNINNPLVLGLEDKNCYQHEDVSLRISPTKNGNYNLIYEDDSKIQSVVALSPNNKVLSLEDAVRNNTDKNIKFNNPLSKEMLNSIRTVFNNQGFNLGVNDLQYENHILKSDAIPEDLKNDKNDLVFTAKCLGVELRSVEIKLKPDNEYTILYSHNGYNNTTKKYDFTADHRLKDENYYKAMQRNERINQGNITAEDISNIALFKELDKTMLQKLIPATGICNVEYAQKQNGIYNLFFDKDGFAYDINIKKVNNNNGNAYAGIAQKLMPDGESEIYIFKTEFLSTNKSDKLRVSHMRVVQDGLEENTPVQKKVLKETHKTGSNTTITSGNINGTKRLNMLAPLIPNIFSPGSNYNGEISSKAINKINEIISEMNAEGKVVTVYSCPKNSNRVEKNGKPVF